MARPKKTDEENLDLFEVAPDELDDALADLPTDDAQLTIYRCKPEGQGHPVFVATYPPSEFSLELIQENHGGGKYNIYAKRNRQIVKRLRVEIEGEPRIMHGTVPLAARKPGGFANWWTKERMAEEQEKAKVTGLDPGMVMLMNEIRNLKESLREVAQNNGSGGFDRKSFMQELVMYKELFSPSNPMGDQTTMISTILQKGLEIGARAANGEVGTSSWVDTIKELIPVAQQALGAFVNKQAIEQAAKSRLPQTQDMVRNVNHEMNKPLSSHGFGDILPDMNTQKPASGFAAIAPMLRAYIPLVIGTASRDGDPGSIIDLIENNLSDEQKPHVVEWLSSPSWYTDLCSLDPRIQLQAAWWSELHDMLLQQLMGVNQESASENGTGEDEVLK
jgi:hypothetical protein